MLILGIDDAGRGPVLGPMVLAGCLIDDKFAGQFKKLGVKDSKQLTHKRRELLAERIREKAETFEVVIIPPLKIDGVENKRTKLNELEALACARIINKINKGFKHIKVVIDCPSTSIVRWTDFLKSRVNDLSTLEISCEHKADKNHVVVSAASILAKCVREREMSKLKEKYGKGIGSGYASDPATQKFLKNHAKKYQNNGIFRKTWITWKRANDSLVQKKLGDF